MEPLAWACMRECVCSFLRDLLPLCFFAFRRQGGVQLEPLVWGECEGAPFCETSRLVFICF
jgi:hypothetical protein